MRDPLASTRVGRLPNIWSELCSMARRTLRTFFPRGPNRLVGYGEGWAMVGADRMEIIDADGHVIEPAVVWKEYAEPAFRERLDRPGGGAQALGMSRSYPDSTMGLGMVANGEGEGDGAGWRSSIPPTVTWKEGVREFMELPGGYDPRARLAYMDEEGIDVAVLYPTSMLTWVEEADLFGAACRAYNSWLHDYCAEAPTRLYPVALVPVQDLDAARKELHRCVDQLGAKAVMVRPAPYLGTKPLYHSDYDPFWAAVAGRGTGRRAPFAARGHAELLPAARSRRRGDEPHRRAGHASGPHERDRPADGVGVVRARRDL